MRWPVMDEVIHMNPKAWGGYAEEVQNVRRFISERLLWMDSKLGYTYDPDAIPAVSSDREQPHRVYSLSGVPYDCDVRHLPRGLYVVKQGDAARKIQVR